MPKVNETWALAKSTVNYFCRLMNGADLMGSIMRTLQVGERPTKLAQAVAALGRIEKTLHILTYI